MTEPHKPEALLWIDFETTDTNRDKLTPLEIGLQCTDVNATTSHAAMHSPIRPRYLNLTELTPATLTMHTDNGLLNEIVADADGRNDIGNVQGKTRKLIDRLADQYTLIPAGTNVDFDVDILKKWIYPDPPLSYRKFDLTTLRHLAKWTGRDTPHKTTNHRTADCIRRDIQEYVELGVTLLGESFHGGHRLHVVES